MLNNHYAAQGAFQGVSFHRALKALPEYSGTSPSPQCLTTHLKDMYLDHGVCTSLTYSPRQFGKCQPVSGVICSFLNSSSASEWPYERGFLPYDVTAVEVRSPEDSSRMQKSALSLRSLPFVDSGRGVFKERSLER